MVVVTAANSNRIAGTAGAGALNVAFTKCRGYSVAAVGRGTIATIVGLGVGVGAHVLGLRRRRGRGGRGGRWWWSRMAPATTGSCNGTSGGAEKKSDGSSELHIDR